MLYHLSNLGSISGTGLNLSLESNAKQRCCIIQLAWWVSLGLGTLHFVVTLPMLSAMIINSRSLPTTLNIRAPDDPGWWIAAAYSDST